MLSAWGSGPRRWLVPARRAELVEQDVPGLVGHEDPPYAGSGVAARADARWCLCMPNKARQEGLLPRQSRHGHGCTRVVPGRIWTEGSAVVLEGCGHKCCREVSTSRPRIPGGRRRADVWTQDDGAGSWCVPAGSSNLARRHDGGCYVGVLRIGQRVQMLLSGSPHPGKVGHLLQIEGCPDVGVPGRREGHGAKGRVKDYKATFQSFSPQWPTTCNM